MELRDGPLFFWRGGGGMKNLSLQTFFFYLCTSAKGRYKSRTGSTRITSPGRINSDQPGSTRIIGKLKIIRKWDFYLFESTLIHQKYPKKTLLWLRELSRHFVSLVPDFQTRVQALGCVREKKKGRRQCFIFRTWNKEVEVSVVALHFYENNNELLGRVSSGQINQKSNFLDLLKTDLSLTRKMAEILPSTRSMAARTADCDGRASCSKEPAAGSNLKLCTKKAGKKPSSCGPGHVACISRTSRSDEAILLLLKPRIKLCIDNK